MSRNDSTYHGLNKGGGGGTEAGGEDFGATSCACAGRGADPVTRIKTTTAPSAANTAIRTPMYTVSHVVRTPSARVR